VKGEREIFLNICNSKTFLLSPDIPQPDPLDDGNPSRKPIFFKEKLMGKHDQPRQVLYILKEAIMGMDLERGNGLFVVF